MEQDEWPPAGGSSSRGRAPPRWWLLGAVAPVAPLLPGWWLHVTWRMRRKQGLLLGSDNRGAPLPPSRSPRRGERQRDEQMIWDGADYVTRRMQRLLLGSDGPPPPSRSPRRGERQRDFGRSQIISDDLVWWEELQSE